VIVADECPGARCTVTTSQPDAMSPLAYQQLLRLEHAATLLAGTDLTVQAVAARCGFQDERQLRRLFSARYGIPPAAARRQPVPRR